MLKGQVAFNIMDPIGEQLEKEIKKEAEVGSLLFSIRRVLT